MVFRDPPFRCLHDEAKPANAVLYVPFARDPYERKLANGFVASPEFARLSECRDLLVRQIRYCLHSNPCNDAMASEMSGLSA